MEGKSEQEIRAILEKRGVPPPRGFNVGKGAGMFNWLMEKLLSLVKVRKAFDPSRFGDPLAMQIAWTPAKSGGASFRTHKLVKIDSSRMEFRASIGAQVFSSVFILMGIVLFIGFSSSMFSSRGFSFRFDIIIPLFISLVFAAAGCCMLYFGSAPVVFDKSKGSFWKGWKAPDEVFDRKKLKYFAELGNIHALQLISEYCSGSDSSFYSYELNIVLKDGGRVNVVDHGNAKKLRDDARVLSAFLDKPVWDAI